MLVLHFDWLPADHCTLAVTIFRKLSWSTYLTNISIRAGRSLGAQWRQARKLNKTKLLSTSHKSVESFNVQ